MKDKNLASLPVYLLSFAGILTAFFARSTAIVVIQFVSMLAIGLIFTTNYKFFLSTKTKEIKLLSRFLIYGLLVATHSAFVARSYEQWSYLVNIFIPFLLLPLFAIVGTSVQLLQKTLKLLLSVTLPLSLLFLIKGAGDKQENLVYVAYVSAIFMFLLFLPMLKIKWKLLVLLVTTISWFWDQENRSNLLNIGFSVGSLVCYVFARRSINQKIFQKLLILLRRILLFAPIIFISLGVSGTFNIFNYFETSSPISNVALSHESGRTLATDSRSGIYTDALNNLSSSGNWIFGSGATAMYATHLIDVDAGYEAGRLGGSESGLLGLLMFGGLVYVLLFFLLCYHASKVALIHSNNRVIKLIGVYVAYKWLFTFIESPIALNFSWVVFFLAIGMTFNRALREASDKDIEKFIRSL